jgi:hypothetical protein
VKITTSFFTLILVLVLCGCHKEQATDAALQQKLTGTWKVEVRGSNGSSDTRGTFTVAADNGCRSELVTTVSNEARPVTLQGYVRIQDGYLVETTTNAVPHWLPEAKLGTLLDVQFAQKFDRPQGR